MLSVFCIPICTAAFFYSKYIKTVNFEILKELCVNAPILAFPDYKLPFILHTDSSTEGLGAVLYQKQKVNLGL